MIRIGLPLIFLLGLVGSAVAGDLNRIEPHPSLSPRDVVAIQLKALRHNDVPYADRGIEVTFNFASPSNRLQTGPLERFKMLVRNPVYGPMIDHRSVKFEKIEISGDNAQVDVVLHARDGRYLGYRFGLARQRGNVYEGSWMTYAVVPFEAQTL